ncbi:MAG TPA: aminomethyltransferase family protein [Actinomycetes bacterium]|nr:aminomethyltransferase family protein [Actinomycetes bacterium]
MVLTTPFHARLAELNTAQLWYHWAGHLSATQYTTAPKHEYFGVRNAVGIFDASPLYKYAIAGRDAERFLGGIFARDIRACRPGRAQYTVWCDDRGFVLEDGVVFRHSENDFLLTAAEPNLAFLEGQIGPLEVRIDDVSRDFAVLAVQGKRARAALAPLVPEVAELRYFTHAPTKIAGSAVTVSRTGFSGDLGFELMIPADNALAVFDAVWEAGQGHLMRPYGDIALDMLRIEGGLPLIGREFTSSRYAFNDHDRFTPDELGLGWLLKGIEDETRPFVGRRAILAERTEGTSRWATVGIVVDWADYDALYYDEGLIPPKDGPAASWETMLYDEEGERAGYATSYVYSPMLQTHIGIARVRPELAARGTRLAVEQTVNHAYTSVPATVTAMPFFNPERKTSMP